MSRFCRICGLSLCESEKELPNWHDLHLQRVAGDQIDVADNRDVRA